MKDGMGSTILGFGHYAPAHRVANAELEQRLGLQAGWIERRTGIAERRWASEGEALSDMAVAAGEMALTQSNVDRAAIALTILATSTPDHLLPPSAPLVAHRLRLPASGAIDMAGACAGFLYALSFADAFARAHGVHVLVIAGNILSRRTNFDDRSSAILFADAAGAVVVAPTKRQGTGILGVKLDSDGSHYGLIQIPSGGSRNPFAEDTALLTTKMEIRDGRAVFVRAVEMMADAANKALATAGLDISAIDHFIPHQANSRIMTATRNKLGIPADRMVSSVRDYGNSSAGTIPLTLSLNTHRFAPGQHLLLSAAGAGLTGGALVYRL